MAKRKCKMSIEEIGAWLQARAAAYRQQANAHAAGLLYIKANSNTVSFSDLERLDALHDLCNQALSMAAAMEEAAQAIIAGDPPDKVSGD